LPLATSSSNSDNEGGSGRSSQRVALIDPKPLTRRSIGDLLAKAFPEWNGRGFHVRRIARNR
jgi:hypothetical protein